MSVIDQARTARWALRFTDHNCTKPLENVGRGVAVLDGAWVHLLDQENDQPSWQTFPAAALLWIEWITEPASISGSMPDVLQFLVEDRFGLFLGRMGGGM